MTDAHCHVGGNDPAVGELIAGRDFIGVHPWTTLMPDDGFDPAAMRAALQADPAVGVGEIGLDRLKVRDIPARMREVFAAQLELAAEFGRPTVLHGAKCWGEVVRACRPYAGRIPAFLFHGFSRSDGLLPDIAKLNGFISVGPAVLNDHAVNYRALVRKIPAEMLLVETDRTAENAADCPSVRDVAAKLAELRGLSLPELETLTDANAKRFRNRIFD